MPRRTITSLSLIPLSLAFSSLPACDTVRAPGSSTADRLPAAAYPQIVVQRDIEQYIVNGTPKVERANIMRVTVPIRLITDHDDMNVQYRFLFLNKDNVPIGEEPGWRWMALSSRNQVFLQGNATDAGAQDWRLEIRPAR